MYFCEYIYTKYKTIDWNYISKTIVTSKEEKKGNGIRERDPRSFDCIYNILFLNPVVQRMSITLY